MEKQDGVPGGCEHQNQTIILFKYSIFWQLQILEKDTSMPLFPAIYPMMK